MTNNQKLMIREMVAKCRSLIAEIEFDDSAFPLPLQRQHLESMCAQVDQCVDDWPLSRLHRWIGFIQCALLANRVIDLDGLKSMFDRAKVAFGDVDEDLIDHLNPNHPYEIDLGGNG